MGRREGGGRREREGVREREGECLVQPAPSCATRTEIAHTLLANNFPRRAWRRSLLMANKSLLAASRRERGSEKYREKWRESKRERES